MSSDPLLDRLAAIDPAKGVVADEAREAALLEDLRSALSQNSPNPTDPRSPKAPRRRRPSLGTVVGVLAAALAVAIAVVALTSLHHTTPSGIGGGPVSSSTTPAITGSIQLNQDSVRSGEFVHGEVIFHNRTSQTKVLTQGCNANGFYGIGLRASDGYIQAPAFALVGCSPEQEMVAKPGTTVYQFKVAASYTQCSQSTKGQAPEGSKYWTPVCLKDPSGRRDIQPPLPPGRYTALFFSSGKWLGPHVAPAVLTVTAATGTQTAPSAQTTTSTQPVVTGILKGSVALLHIVQAVPGPKHVYNETATARVFSSDGQLVAVRNLTLKKEVFSVRLAPGRYRVTISVSGGPCHASPTSWVRVLAHRTERKFLADCSGTY